MARITRAVKSEYELLAIKWSSKIREGELEEARLLKDQLLGMEQALGMTPEEILASTPDE